MIINSDVAESVGPILKRTKQSALRRMLVVGTAFAVALLVAGCSSGGGSAPVARRAGVPAAGQSSTIDAVVQRGTLRVGVLALPPWLLEDTSAGNKGFSGVSWTLAEAYAKALGVKLETVPVSNDTKVTALNTKQFDISITPLAETKERNKVVDFVTYSATAICYAGLDTNPKITKVKKVDDINSPELSMAYFVGASQEPYLPVRFPKLKLVGVTGAGAGVPIEQLLSGRADLIVFNVVEWPALQKRYPHLTAFPSNCEGSNEQKVPLGHAIAKGDPVFLKFLTKIEKGIDSQLQDQLKQQLQK